MQELAEKYRSELIEAIAENDEELMMKYLDGEELTIPEMKVAIRKGDHRQYDRSGRVRHFL